MFWYNVLGRYALTTPKCFTVFILSRSLLFSTPSLEHGICKELPNELNR